MDSRLRGNDVKYLFGNGSSCAVRRAPVRDHGPHHASAEHEEIFIFPVIGNTRAAPIIQA